LHPASIGASTASINAMQADCARKPDMLKPVAPVEVQARE
jgi:hypothetical protein